MIVPSFFCVTTKAFRAQINSQKRNLEIFEELCNYFRNAGAIKELNSVFAQAKLLRVQIENEPIDGEIIEAIRKSYNKLCEDLKEENISVAVRSSATTEDTKEASY